MIVLMVVVEYTTRVVTLVWMCIIALCGVDVIISYAIERYVSCVMVVRVRRQGRWR